MHYDVTSCVICISNDLEYLEKEGSYKNSSKIVILIFAMQSKKRSKKFRCIDILNYDYYKLHKIIQCVPKKMSLWPK